ncbi:MAG: metallophosphoesterase [Planctomycetota bacterium]
MAGQEEAQSVARQQPASTWPRRLARLGAGVLALVVSIAGQVVLLAILAFSETRRLEVVQIEAELPHLSPAWSGETVAVLGDFQLGLFWDNMRTAEKAVQHCLDADPCAVLLLGDFVYRMEEAGDEVGRVRRVLQPLADSDIPVFAVLGNHDHGMAWQDDDSHQEHGATVQAMLIDLGIELLDNRHARIQNGTAGALHVVGLGSAYAEDDHCDLALLGLDETTPRIVMMHNPESFRDIAADAAPVAFAGHTHGGQIRLPWTPDWEWVTWFKRHYPPMDGWAEPSWGAGTNRLYVNRGIGMSQVPLRLNCLPELTLVTLRATDAD